MSDKFLMDSHKMLWHPERVAAWKQGEPIAPLHIDAGLSKGCNIKCAYCFGALQRNNFAKGEIVYFPREPLLAFMGDAGKAGVRSIAFIGEAEPLMNPHVYEAIVAGKRANVDMAIGTNGILWDTGSAGEEALAHLQWIRFNISAASEESYRRIHASKDFHKAVAKIRFCVETKARKNLPVTIGMQMVLIPGNVDQVVALARLGRQLGVDYLVVKQCSDTTENGLGIYQRLDSYHAFQEILQEAEGESREGYSVIIKWNKISNQGRRSYDSCLGVPFLLYGSGDGKLYPCGIFFDKDEELFRIGDLTQNSLLELLASVRYREVVERVQAINVHTDCYTNCRTHAINEYLWQIKHPPPHVNFV